MSIRDSLAEFGDVIRLARAEGMKVRGYVSTAFGCPFEGRVKPAQGLRVARRLLELGVDELSIGDTIGVATPDQMAPVFRPLLRDTKSVAGHFHDTRGTALANALAALDLGVRALDSSAGGLGGCPFAPGAAGNLATEDLVYMLQGMGIQTGIDLKALARASLALARQMRRPISSRYLAAYQAAPNAFTRVGAGR
jgi:isopropylmalate/homocitrate/citramalate synthase